MCANSLKILQIRVAYGDGTRPWRGTRLVSTVVIHPVLLFPILRELQKSSNLKILKYKLDLDQNMKVVKHILKYLDAEFSDEKISFDWANLS